MRYYGRYWHSPRDLVSIQPTEPRKPWRRTISNVRPYTLSHAVISATVCAGVLVIGIMLFRNFVGNSGHEPSEERAVSRPNTSPPPPSADVPAVSRSDSQRQRIEATDATLQNLEGQTKAKLATLETEVGTANKEIAQAEMQIGKLLDDLTKYEVIRAPIQAQAVAVKERAEKALSDLQDLAAELDSWSTKFKSLLTSDEGKKIVAAGNYLDLFANLAHKNRPSDSQLAVWRKQLKTLLEPLRTAAEKSGQTVVTSADVVSLIDDVGKNVRGALDDLRQDQKVLEMILRDTAGATAGEVTLDQALGRKKEEETRVLSRRIAEAHKSQWESSTRLLEEAEKSRVAAEAAKQKQVIDNERQRIELATEELKNKAVAEKETFEAQQAKAKLGREMDGEMQEIRDLLQPFLAPGFAQMVESGSFRSTMEKKPFSFSVIRAQARWTAACRV